MLYATDVPVVAGAPERPRTIPPGLTGRSCTSRAHGHALAEWLPGGPPCPHAIVSAEDVQAGKPAPDPYLAGAAALGLNPAAYAVSKTRHWASRLRVPQASEGRGRGGPRYDRAGC